MTSPHVVGHVPAVPAGNDGSKAAFLEKRSGTNNIQPTQVTAWLNKGNALVMLGRHAEALLAYDQGLRYAPDSWIFLHNKGAAYSAMGKKKEAQYYMEHAEQLRKEQQ